MESSSIPSESEWEHLSDFSSSTVSESSEDDSEWKLQLIEILPCLNYFPPESFFIVPSVKSNILGMYVAHFGENPVSTGFEVI